MFTADEFRARAAECAELLRNTVVPSEMREHQRSQESFNLLAQNEDWLADNFDKIVRSHDFVSQRDVVERRVDSKAAAAIDEHVLRCLGAAVIMQWNAIPTTLQRELFDTAGSLGDVLPSIALRGKIARFLHHHKDNESPPVAGDASSVTKG